MFKFLKNNKSATTWFVAISLLALFLLVLLLLYFSATFGRVNVVSNNTQVNNRILDLSDDPFITFPGDSNYTLTEPIIDGNDPVLGPVDAPVTIVYFADYDCQYCTEQLSMIKQMQTKYLDKVRVIWKDYPETSANTISFKAALAGRCAYQQDKFWEFENSFANQFPIFSAQQGTSAEAFDSFILGTAQELDLNLNSFKACLASDTTLQPIQANFDEAQALGLPGVPFTFVNDKEVLGQYSSNQLEDMIQEVLNSN